MTIAENLAYNNIVRDLSNGVSIEELREVYKDFLVYDSIKEILGEN